MAGVPVVITDVKLAFSPTDHKDAHRLTEATFFLVVSEL